MKRTRLMMMVMLLSALLITGCAQAAALAEELPTEGEAAEVELSGYAFQDFPKDAYPAAKTAGASKVVDDSLFHAKFEGDAVSGSGGAVGGMYRFIATETDGESWHVKLEANYPTVAGRDYFVTYRFNSDVAGKVKFGDFQEFEITEGENTVTGVFTAKEGTSYLDLQLGMLPAFTIDFTEIQVKEFADEVEYVNALPKPVNFERESRVYEKHDTGYDTILVRASHAINVNYESIPMDLGVWKSRLYVRTGLVPEPGVHYRVTADVMSDRYDRNIPFEVLFNDGSVEKGYGALYGQELVPGQVNTIEAVITGNGNGDELILQFSLGEARAGSLVIVGNVKVDKIVDHYASSLADDYALDTSIATGVMIDELVPVAYEGIPVSPTFYSGVDSVYEQHDDGYVVNLTEDGTSATMNIAQAPANEEDRGVWKAKLYAATDVTLMPGTDYRIQFDLDSASDQAEYEVCFDGDAENAYGALYGRSLTAGGTDHVDMLITPEESRGPLTVRLQLGKTDSASGNTVTLRNFTVESVQLKYTDILPASFSYNTKIDDSGVEYVSVLPDDFSYTTGINVWEGHDEGYTQDVSSDGTSATLAITEAPASDRGVWKSKLYINTGVTPKAKKSYAVSFDITADKDQAQYEACFDGAEENKYGALYDLKLQAGKTQSVRHSFVAEEVNGPIVIRLQLGNTDSASGNTIKVSNVKVCELGEGIDMEEIELPDDFAYPVVTEETTDPGSFFLEANSGAAAELTGDGSSATATVTTPGDDWHVKLYAQPGLELEAGETYTISMDVTGASGCTACYKNTATGAEDGFGTEAISAEGTVTHTVTPSEGGTLEIMLKIGNVEAGTEVTVSNIKIMKRTTDFITIPVSIAYPTTSEPTTIHHDDEYEAQAVTVSADAVAWDDSVATASASGNSATLEVTTARAADKGGMWSTRLEAGTGVTLEKGVTYKVSGTLTSAKPLDFEVLYSNGAGTDEGAHNPGGQGYAEGSWGLKVDSDGGSCYFEKEFTVPELSDYRPLVLRVQVGNGPAPNTITLSDITVQKLVPGYDETVPGELDPGSFDLEANSGADAELSGTGSSAIAKVTTPGDDWHVKFYAKPGVNLEAGKTYQISMDVTGADGCTACYKNTATGAEDGFGTEAISSGTVTHTVTPSEDGTLEIMLKIGNVAADTEVTVSNIKIAEYKTGDVDVTPEGFVYPTTTGGGVEKNSFDVEANEGAAAELSGTETSAIAKVTTPGDDWHVKFYAKPGVELEAGQTYRISMDVTGASGCMACYKNTAVEGEEGFGTQAIKSDGTLTHTVTADETGELEILLKIGNLAANTEVTISNIKIMKVAQSEGPNLMKDALLAWAPIHQFSDAGYVANLTNDASSATMNVTAVADEQADWKAKLYVETGAALKAGKQYRISYDIQANKSFTYHEFDGSAADEKAVAEYYNLSAGSKQTVEHLVIPADNAELIIQLLVGYTGAPNKIKVSNVKVEEVVSESGALVVPINFWAHEDYEASLSNTKSCASMAITKAPAEGREPWKVKLFAETGAKLEAGKTYRVSVDVKATKPLTYDICYNNQAEEAALGAKYALEASTSKQTVTHTITAGQDAVLFLQFSLGNSEAANTVTISNVKVEEVEYTSAQNAIPGFSYDSVGYFSKQSDLGYVTALRKGPASANFQITQAPFERHAWNAKLVVRTGITPKAGMGYRVTFNVNAAKPQNLFEVFYNGDEELAYGAQYEQTLAAGNNSFSYTIMPGDSKGELVLHLRFGETNGTDGNAYTVSDFTFEEVTFVESRHSEIKDVVENDTQDGYSAQLTRSSDKAMLQLVETPADGLEAWKNKLFVYTGITLEPDQKYRVSFNVKSIVPAPFEVCFNNGNEEKGVGAIFGLTSKPYGEFVEFTKYADKEAPLVIQLSLGNCTAPNTFFLSDVKVEKAGKVNLVSNTVYTF